MDVSPDTANTMKTWRCWVLASRPKTLTAAAAPVLVGWGIAIARGGFHAPSAFAALVVALAIQIGTNFHNDVSDFLKGTDRAGRLGPTRVTQAGILPPQAVKRGVVFTFGIACLAGLYLVSRGGLPVLLVGAASLLAALAYSAGPSPLSENGLADVFVLIFFGLVAVGGTVYVQLGSIPVETWFSAVAVGSTITALLVVNNVRDIESDRLSGRRTVPVVWGRKAGILEYRLLLGIAYVAPVLMVLMGAAGTTALLPLFTLPLGFRWSRYLAENSGRELNRCLAGTAALLFLHGCALALGIALTRWVSI